MNLKTLLTSVEILREEGLSLPKDTVLKGLSAVTRLTGLRGRWETLGYNPRIICDTGHNEAGIRQVVKQIDEIPKKHLLMVWGMVSDKDISRILPLLPKEASWFFARSSVPRSIDPEELKQKAITAGLKGNSYNTVKEAVEAARRSAGADDFIFIGGSTFVVADALALFPSPETKL